MTLHITQFAGIDHTGSAHIQAANRPLASQALALSGANAQSDPMHEKARLVRVHAGEACLVTVGENADATAGKTIRLDAGQFDYLAVLPGDVVAAVTA
ncbi:hypothetical protein [uncultured Arenimonas sp.]|uniref:hypothetical protein n=1 Tax=uncultured Arenimonas sp. TaxID=546226 RepID=UPI0030D9A458